MDSKVNSPKDEERYHRQAMSMPHHVELLVLYADTLPSHPYSKALVSYRVADECDRAHDIHAAAVTNDDSSAPLLRQRFTPKQLSRCVRVNWVSDINVYTVLIMNESENPCSPPGLQGSNLCHPETNDLPNSLFTQGNVAIKPFLGRAQMGRGATNTGDAEGYRR